MRTLAPAAVELKCATLAAVGVTEDQPDAPSSKLSSSMRAYGVSIQDSGRAYVSFLVSHGIRSRLRVDPRQRLQGTMHR